MRAKNAKKALTVHEIAVFSMLGALMYCSKLLLEWAPNIHLLALFVIAITRVYRKKALIPIYLFVLLTLIFNGFTPWVMPYLYVWTLLWGAVMLLPRQIRPPVAIPVYLILGALHGILFGVFFAPCQALFFGLDLKGTLAWIAAGLYFDILHAIGNFAACTLCVPLIRLLSRLEKRSPST